MLRSTIDYGISLGISEGSVALFTKGQVEVIPNERGMLVTPAAIWIDKRNRIRIGQEAKDRHELDPANVAVEFLSKIGFGPNAAHRFQDTGRSLLPEELVAEFLKHFIGAALVNKGEAVRSAVVTVPVECTSDGRFGLQRAMQLAGLDFGLQLPEPVAAAWAYGLADEGLAGPWLCCSLHDTSATASIVTRGERGLEIVGSAWDSMLGVTQIDRHISDEVFAPHLANAHRLRDFTPDNPRWRTTFAKLRCLAREARLGIARTRKPWGVWSDAIGEDEQGRAFDFEFTLSREINQAAAPILTRFVQLCRGVLAKTGGLPKPLKAIYWGEPSVASWARQMLKKSLEVDVDDSVDPATAVVRGAAIFASTQPIGGSPASSPPASGPDCKFSIQLEFDPVGNVERPEIAGRVRHPQGVSLKGFTLQIKEQKSQWNSGRIRLGDNGAFETTLHAEKKRRNLFSLELRDAAGNSLPVAPDTFPYTISAEFDGQPLSQTIGIAMHDGKVIPLIRQGASLPATARCIFRTDRTYSREQREAIRFPIIAGEYFSRSDRNRWVGNLEIPTSEFRRDLPTGAELELAVSIDASGIIAAEVYIPLLDLTFEAKLNMERTHVSPGELRRSIDQENERYKQLVRALQALLEIDRDQVLDQIERFYAAGIADPSALLEAEDRLRVLGIRLDDIIDALSPLLAPAQSVKPIPSNWRIG